MKHLSNVEAARWLAARSWISPPADNGVRFEILDREGLIKYEATIAQDSASVGCDMAALFLHDVPESDFPGALFWIARAINASERHWLLVEQVLRAGGLRMPNPRPEFLLLEPIDYGGCFALVALALMLGWDANLVLADRRFLLTIDDEPFPALITDHASEWFIQAAKNLDFKVSSLRND